MFMKDKRRIQLRLLVPCAQTDCSANKVVIVSQEKKKNRFVISILESYDLERLDDFFSDTLMVALYRGSWVDLAFSPSPISAVSV